MFKINLFIVLSLVTITILSGSFILDSKIYISNLNESDNTDIENSDAHDEIRDDSDENINNLDELINSNSDIYDSSINLVNDNRGIPVLYYHSVNDTVDNEVTISPKLLKRHLKYIKDQGYITLSMNEVDYNEDSVKAAKNAGYSIAFTTNKGFADRDDNPLELNRIYVNSYYDMNTFISILKQTKK